ncbi:copper chaperone PCu(A)C [Frigidibacter mobilis]|uniref:Copper(I)-binding protein n=1 Tax=Frigidibacter mobilis TaxID=1335048 RepID=A0A159Z267_9RHOB|nr:copper chaperone PCu(A)C [Frigidibacter mobilis]AMY68104.1 hypothetical protein AKL17_0845 [Frigidibacter mobilis]
MKRTLILIAAALLAGTSAFAHGVTAGDLEIIHPAIPAPSPAAKSAAGYMAISNGGAGPDRLLAVEGDFAQQIMLHTTEFSADGVARMMHLEAIEIPAGETVVLEPGGMHVMLMGLTGPLAEGEHIPATLVFEKAGRVEVEFAVDPAGAEGDHADHADHAGH